MKILESAPNRYDTGIRILTLGRLDKAYDRLTSHIKSGQKVLDMGCGTGALTIRAALKGATVKGIDINSQMLEIAKKRANKMNVDQNIEFLEIGVAELDNERTEDYDVVMSGLCFSELTDDELQFTLKEVKRILKPNGLLLVADEVIPDRLIKKMFNKLLRLPLVIITFLLTQTTTRGLEYLPEIMEREGFLIESYRKNKMENFAELIGLKPAK